MGEQSITVTGLVDLSPIGQGGFGTVYRAWQVGLGREVALKVDSRVLVDERDRRRFLREASAAGRLSGHGHIVAVYDAGVTADGRPYLVMELCPGGSLADHVYRTGPMPAEQVRRIGIGIADALATAHAAGILHRDVKPPNILLDAYGVAKLADFGLAAVLDASGDSSVTREALTPAYAPPEAFAFARPTAAGDVYGLAATLYAVLAGRPPRAPSWPPQSFTELSDGLRAPVPPIAGVPADLMAVIARALEPEPDRRTAAADLRDALCWTPATGLAVGSPGPGGGSGPSGSPPAPGPPVASPGPVGGSGGGESEPGRAASVVGRPVGSPGWADGSVGGGSGPGGSPPVGVGVPAPSARPAGSPAAAGSAPRRLAARPIAGGPAAPARHAARRHARARPGPLQSRRSLVAIIAAALLAVGLGTAVLIAGRGIPTARTSTTGLTASSGPPTDRVSGSAAGADRLPPSLVSCIGSAGAALCPTTPTCWDRLTAINGHKVEIGTIGCDRPHRWEAYVAGRLPAGADVTAAELNTRPDVTAVCTVARMQARARPGVDPTGWTRDVQPLTVAGYGSFFYCVASPNVGGVPTDSLFITGPG